QLGQQLNTLASSSLSQAELSPLFERLDELTQQVINLNSQHFTTLDAISHCENELNKKADNTTISSIEVRIARLEKIQEEYRKLFWA
ncbi:MAG: hypothetical protein Q8O55_08350, partial [Dehalococcoidales bacterium]|nr:hypothetical protein [Dehalococcoidales bacterium]